MSEIKSVLDFYPEYRTDIGIEVHVQLNTKTKIFCSCSNEQTDIPNKNICPICAGYPGTLPVLNKEVITKAIKAAIATNSKINLKNTFSRKHYFYPDLPKNYQITQDKEPFCENGYIMITKEDGTLKKIRLFRIHIEEDAGKNIHANGSESFVDLNRTGTPLLEIVSYPDIESSHEAKLYLKTLHSIIKYIGISTANMDEGSFRADSNVSVRKKTSTELGTRCELKNINSFKFVGDAIEYEIERQINLIEEGGKVIQATRLWDSKNKITQSMRTKEEAADYRYFDDPDLPSLYIDQKDIDFQIKNMPELPDQKLKRLQNDYGLSLYESTILIDDTDLCDYFENASKSKHSKKLINWILKDVISYLKENKISIKDFLISPEKLSEIVNLVETDVINNRSAQELFILCIQNQTKTPLELIKEYKMEQLDNFKEIEEIINEIIKNNQNVVADYKSGKTKLFGFFVGQVMKKTEGKANPKTINDLLIKALN